MIPEYYRVRGLASPFLYKRDLSIYEEPDFDYIIIKINEEHIEERGSIYETTRRAWKAKLESARPYKYVFSVGRGVVLEVFEVEQWQVCAEYPDRIEFVGHVAPDSIAKQVKGKMIPEYYRVRGLASPFLYKKKLAANAEISEPAAPTFENTQDVDEKADMKKNMSGEPSSNKTTKKGCMPIIFFITILTSTIIALLL